MEKHYGQIVEYIVRKNGYSITDLATELKVDRRSLYNWFHNKCLKPDIIYKIGLTIKHDFSKEFAELFSIEEFDSIYAHRTISYGIGQPLTDNWKNKYLLLLEQYSELLSKRTRQRDTEPLS